MKPVVRVGIAQAIFRGILFGLVLGSIVSALRNNPSSIAGYVLLTAVLLAFVAQFVNRKK